MPKPKPTGESAAAASLSPATGVPPAASGEGSSTTSATKTATRTASERKPDRYGMAERNGTGASSEPGDASASKADNKKPADKADAPALPKPAPPPGQPVPAAPPVGPGQQPGPAGFGGGPPRTSTSPGLGGTTAGIRKNQVADAVREARRSVADAVSRNARRARLELRKIDPWSVMKFSFAASLVLFITFVVATALLYTVLDAMGVFDSVNETVRSLTTTNDESSSSGGFELDAKMVIGGAALLGAVNMVLFTALATLGAFIYNVCADLAGGIELTLAERD